MHINEHIIDYLDGTLSHSLKEQVENHLPTCDHCTSLVEYFRKTYGLIKHEKAFEPKPYFYTRLRAKMDSPVNSEKLIGLSVKKLSIPLGIAASIIIGIFIGNQEKNIQSDRTVAIKELSEELLPVDYNEFVYLANETND